jgi:hypothetical protein
VTQITCTLSSARKVRNHLFASEHHILFASNRHVFLSANHNPCGSQQVRISKTSYNLRNLIRRYLQVRAHIVKMNIVSFLETNLSQCKDRKQQPDRTRMDLRKLPVGMSKKVEGEKDFITPYILLISGLCRNLSML